MGWDERWMDLSVFISDWSKDKSRKVGCVITDNRNVLLSIGWNGFPRNINDDIINRHKRPDKYYWTEHAERNAIYNAAAKGISLLYSTMYLPWYPCSDCARAIIQSGIKKIVCLEPDWKDPKFSEDFKITREMLIESEIIIKYITGYSCPKQKALEV